MRLRPFTRDEANRLIAAWHSHHRPVRSHRFAIGALECDQVVGVVVIGNPVARPLADGTTLEVTRLCTDGHPNAASFLLGAAWRAARAMGVRRLVSYTRADESGTCYRAAGWRPVAGVRGCEWTREAELRYLPGLFTPATETVDRVRWEVP